MVVSNMAGSVLQLSLRAGLSAVDGRSIATCVPALGAGRFGRVSALPALVLCGLLHAAATERCNAATPVCAHATAMSAEPPSGGADAPADATVIEAFVRARGWLAVDSLPAPSEQAARLELANTAGVSVILRLDGRLVGTGDDDAGDDLMLRRAVGRAVNKALGDETVRAVRQELDDKVTARFSLELELAGPAKPLLGRTIADAAARLTPGTDGIAVRRGDAFTRAYPSRLLASDIAARPERTIAALLVDAGLPVKDLNEFPTGERVSLARFATRRMRQAAPSEPPVFLTRGGRTIELREVTPSSTRILAIQLAARLAGQVIAADPADPSKGVRLLGTLNPTADEYDPPFANPQQSALVAFALAQAAGNGALPESLRTRARASATALAASVRRELAEQASGASTRDAGFDERAGFASPLLSVAIARCTEQGDPLRAAEAERISRMPPSSDGAATSPSSTLLSLAADLELGDDGQRERAIGKLAEQLDGLETRPAAVLGVALPLAVLAGADELPDAQRTRIRAALAAVARGLADAQVIPAKSGADGATAGGIDGLSADLIGGLIPPTGARLDVDSATLVHAAALLQALPAPADAASPELARMRRAFVRFVMQHAAADPWVDGFRRPEVVRGLVRASLATDDCPPEATALGLLVALGALDNPDASPAGAQ